MNTHQLIYYVWYVPVVVMILTPLLWSLGVMLYRVYARARLGELTGCIEMNYLDTASPGKTELRTRPRIRLKKGHAYLDTLSKGCRADVLNISKTGICLKDVPETFDIESKPVHILLPTGKGDYRFTIKPMWRKKTRSGCEIGAEIKDIPKGWNHLLNGFTQFCPIRTV